MAYNKPLDAVKLYNPVAVRLGVGGASAVVVRGRRSGVPRWAAVVPVEHGGALHLVSLRGESDWVRNLRAAGRCELRGKHWPGSYFATELAGAQRRPVIAAYRQRVGRVAASSWSRLPDDDDHPVFRLTRACGPV